MNSYSSQVKKFLMIFSLLASVILLAGCDGLGSDGPRGKAGDAGAVGSTGTTGADAPTDTVDDLQSQVDDLAADAPTMLESLGAGVEQCSVCHSNSEEIHAIDDQNALEVLATDVTDDAIADTITMTVTIGWRGGALYTDGFLGGADTEAELRAYVAHLAGGEWVEDVNYIRAVRNGALTSDYGYLYDESDKANGNYSLTFPRATDVPAPDAEDVFALSDVDPTLTYRAVFYVRAVTDTNGDGEISRSGGDYRSFIQAIETGVGTLGETKDLVSAAACNQCHFEGNYIIHGGRSDPNFCVVCHNPGHMAGDEEWVQVNMIHGIHNSHHNGGYSSRDIEIGYPQSMSNCETCHQTAAQLAAVTADANFEPSLCITCHGGADNAWSWDNFEFGTTAMADFHSGFTTSTNCLGCHDGSQGPVLSEVHNGRDMAKELGSEIAYYTPSVTVDGDTATVVWGAYDTATDVAYDVTNLDADAGPVFLEYVSDRNNESEGVRLLVGYYGWGTDDVVSYEELRSWTTTEPNMHTATTYDAASGKATTTMTLDPDRIVDYSAERGVVGIIGVPTVDGELAAVTSVVKDFSFDGSAVTARPDRVDVAKCDVCHDNILLHTNSPYGHTAVGEVQACVICHNPSAAAGHYAQQSRAGKSYFHAIHAEQPTFTVYGTAGVEGHVIEFPGRLDNCEACHDAGTYEVPSMTSSLGGVLSGFEDASTNRANNADQVLQGPGALACGSCHRSLMLEESKGLVGAFNSHTKTFGFRIAAAETTLQELMDYVMSLL